MKTYVIAFVAVAGSLFAADLPRGLKFNDTKVTLPSLQLSDEAGNHQPATPYQPVFSNFPSLDLIAPDSTRQGIIQQFMAPQRAGRLRFGPNRVRSEIIRVPLSRTDLIGPSSDREKLIQQVRSSIDAQPASTK